MIRSKIIVNNSEKYDDPLSCLESLTNQVNEFCAGKEVISINYYSEILGKEIAIIHYNFSLKEKAE